MSLQEININLKKREELALKILEMVLPHERFDKIDQTQYVALAFKLADACMYEQQKKSSELVSELMKK